MLAEFDTLCAADVPATPTITEWVSSTMHIHICKRGGDLVVTLSGLGRTSFIGAISESKSNFTLEQLKASPKMTLASSGEKIVVRLLDLNDRVTTSQEFPLQKLESHDALRESLIAIRCDPLPDYEISSRADSGAAMQTLARLMAEVRMHT